MKKTPSYWRHLKDNWLVAARCLLLALMHALHGLIPCRFTEHEYWGL